MEFPAKGKKGDKALAPGSRLLLQTRVGHCFTLRVPIIHVGPDRLGCGQAEVRWDIAALLQEADQRWGKF